MTDRIPNLLGVLMLALLLNACAGMGKPPELQVQERAQERWDLLVAEDYADAYEYLTPAYRSATTLSRYQRKLLSSKVQWTGAQASEGDCSEDTCKVKIIIDFAVYGAVPGVSKMESKSSAIENWLKVNGQWYFLPRN